MVGRLLPLNKEAGKSEQRKKTKVFHDDQGFQRKLKYTSKQNINWKSENLLLLLLNSLNPDKMSPITYQAKGPVTEQMWLYD